MSLGLVKLNDVFFRKEDVFGPQEHDLVSLKLHNLTITIKNSKENIQLYLEKENIYNLSLPINSISGIVINDIEKCYETWNKEKSNININLYIKLNNINNLLNILLKYYGNFILNIGRYIIFRTNDFKYDENLLEVLQKMDSLDNSGELDLYEQSNFYKKCKYYIGFIFDDCTKSDSNRYEDFSFNKSGNSVIMSSSYFNILNFYDEIKEIVDVTGNLVNNSYKTIDSINLDEYIQKQEHLYIMTDPTSKKSYSLNEILKILLKIHNKKHNLNISSIEIYVDETIDIVI